MPNAAASESKLEGRSSQEEVSQSGQSSGVDLASSGAHGPSPVAAGTSGTVMGASPGVGGVAAPETATVSITLSADSAQRLKAKAAESGLHRNDSGPAGELVSAYAAAVSDKHKHAVVGYRHKSDWPITLQSGLPTLQRQTFICQGRASQ